MILDEVSAKQKLIYFISGRFGGMRKTNGLAHHVAHVRLSI